MSRSENQPGVAWLDDGTMVILVIDEAESLMYPGPAEIHGPLARTYWERVAEDLVREGRRNWTWDDEEEEP